MENKLIDIHAHLCSNEFTSSIDKLAKEMGNDYIVLNAGENSRQNTEIIKLHEKYEFILPCIGLHPNEIAKISYDEAERELNYLIENVEKAFAISEIGLDYKNKDIYQMEVEKELLYKILEVAADNNKVCIIHSRKSMDDLLDILSSFKLKVIIHNFEGNLRQLERTKEMGINISISTGFMKFKRDNIIKKVDIANIFTETDSPVLSPDTKTNTPLNVKRLLNYIANIRGVDMEEVMSNVYKNFRRVFYD